MKPSPRLLRRAKPEKRKRRKVEAQVAHGKVDVSGLSASNPWSPAICTRLNDGPFTPATKRVAKLIELIHQLREASRELNDAVWKFKGDPGWTPTFYQRNYLILPEDLYSTGGRYRVESIERLNGRYNHLMKSVNTILLRYRWIPLLRQIVQGSPPGWVGIMPWWRARDNDVWWENHAVYWLLPPFGSQPGDLTRFFRIRRCRECQKWFYSITDHQKFCSDACRKKFASHDEIFKQKRRDYMREYRKHPAH